MGGVEELVDLHPVEIGRVKSDGKPTSIAVVWRPAEATALHERVELERVCQEVKRPSGRSPARARRRRRAVEDREPSSGDAEEWPVLERGLLDIAEGQTRRPDACESLVVVRVSHGVGT